MASPKRRMETVFMMRGVNKQGREGESGEHVQRPVHGFEEGLHFLFRIVQGKGGAGSPGGAQGAHERLAAMVQEWEAWEATMPPIRADAPVCLGYGVKDMPQR